MDCENCKLRKYYARTWDIHFDYLDCPYKEKCKFYFDWKAIKGDEND